MTKKVFLRQLRFSLQRKAGEDRKSGTSYHDKIEETVRWYEDYILMQIRKGKDEAEVLEYLGDPRLLADSAFIKEELPEIYEEWQEDVPLSLWERIKKRLRRGPEPKMRGIK